MGIMMNIFIATQMIKVLHAPICIYSAEGDVIQCLEENNGKKLIDKEDFSMEISKTIPCIHVKENGVAFCLMWVKEEGYFLGLGKIRIYDFGDEEASQYPYCQKDEFATIVSILWNVISGKEVGVGELWAKNVFVDISDVREQITKDVFERQEAGKPHNPYAQELRELDSIRRGDIAALKKSINETYSGNIGILASDPVRQYKNLAICVITNATRCAIEGGLNPELAFSMSDSFIRNIEDNMTEPVKIEKATRDAEFEFANAVHDLKGQGNDNPLVMQVRDYVFCHIHDAIRVREIAEFIGVTPNYLSEQFSQAMGMTLKQYIINEKISSSENLLKYTDYSLQEISTFCAFSSQSRFSVYFQRKNGITPAKYRKKYKKTRNE